jgi:hypothetical protein
MRTILLGLIRLYVWAMGPWERRREQARIKAKLDRLRSRDNFNYPTY